LLNRTLLLKDKEFVEMKVIDNGIGLPNNFPNKRNKSLGLELLSILSQQINAEYKYESKNGETVFYMEFLQK
jgi:two-component sensor histidine kinase